MKQVWKKVIAVVCMAAMIVAGIGVFPELRAKAEESPEGLTEIGWTDFGFTEDAAIQYNESGYGTTDKTITGKSFVGSSFRGEVQFQKTAGKNMWIQFGGSLDTLLTKGIRVTASDDGNLILYDMISDGNDPLDNVTPSAAGLPDGSTFLNTKFELGLDLWQPEGTNNLKVNFYINGIRYNDQAYVVTDGANGMETTIDFMVADANDSMTLTLPREKAPENILNPVKWSDFGFTEDFTLTESDNWGVREQALSSKSIVNSSFRGKVQFQRAISGNMWIQYGSNSNDRGSKGVRVTLATDGTLKIYDMVHGGEELDIVYPAKTNLGEGNTFSNTEFELGIDLWTSDESDVKIIIYINGVQYNRTAYTIADGSSSMLNYVDIVGQGTGNSVTVKVDKENAPDGLKVIGWKDLGITEDQKYMTNGNLSPISSGVELTGISFRGKVLFDGTDEPYISFGTNLDTWGGLRIGACDDFLHIQIPYMSVDKKITIAQVNNTEMESFVNTEFELGLAIWAEENNIKVLVFVNGEQMNAAPYVWEGGVNGDHVFTDIVAVCTSANSSVTIVPEAEPSPSPEGLTKIGWKDLGLEGKKYGYGGTWAGMGHCSAVTFKNASFRGVVQFNGANTKLTYGDHWDGYEIGLTFVPMVDGTLQVQNVSDNNKIFDNLNPFTAGIPSFLGQEFELGIDSWAEGTDIKFNLFVNGKQYNTNAYVWSNGVSSEHLYNHITVGLRVIAETDSITVELPAESAVNLDDEPAGYLLKGTTIRVNDKKATNGDTLTTVGDYHVVVSGNNNVTATDVGCYTPGDSHVDGIIDIRDVVATKKEIIKATEGANYSSVSRHYAADVNDDTAHNSTDMEWIRNNIVGVTNVTPNLVAAYSLTSDPLEMPIGGFNGPYSVSGRDLITDKIYEKIADCGINFISSPVHEYPTDGKATTEIERVLTQLQLAEKYNLGCFVSDHHAMYAKDVTWTAKSLAERMQLFSNYKSFLGLFMGDEPTVSRVYGSSMTADGEVYAGEYFNRRKEVSALTNSFANVTAYMSLLPYRETNVPDLKLDTSMSYNAAYRTYLQTYCNAYQPKFLSYDNYPFEGEMDAIQGTQTKSDYGYFKNLAIVREVAEEYQIPFWTHVQAGDYFDKEAGGTNNHNPSKGKFKWQINVELAFGAKGIQYFPLVQPDGYETTESGTTDYTRNGLIGKDGNTTEWYAYAKEMNQQIKSMDYVLMNSVSKGIMAYGNYATANINTANESSKTALKLDNFALGGDNPTITGLSSTDSEYGAIAGCFDYLGKTAVYVVNYNVNSVQSISLTWGKACRYKVLEGSTEKNPETPAASYTFELGAGEAGLLVF